MLMNTGSRVWRCLRRDTWAAAGVALASQALTAAMAGRREHATEAAVRRAAELQLEADEMRKEMDGRVVEWEEERAHAASAMELLRSRVVALQAQVCVSLRCGLPTLVIVIAFSPVSRPAATSPPYSSPPGSSLPALLHRMLTLTLGTAMHKPGRVTKLPASSVPSPRKRA